jgi:hypothetical protein
MGVVSATPWPLYPRESNLVPTVEEAGWTPEPVWKGAAKLAPTKTRSTDRPAHNESLCRLLYLGQSVHQKKIDNSAGFCNHPVKFKVGSTWWRESQSTTKCGKKNFIGLTTTRNYAVHQKIHSQTYHTELYTIIHCILILSAHLDIRKLYIVYQRFIWRSWPKKKSLIVNWHTVSV